MARKSRNRGYVDEFDPMDSVFDTLSIADIVEIRETEDRDVDDPMVTPWGREYNATFRLALAD